MPPGVPPRPRQAAAQPDRLGLTEDGCFAVSIHGEIVSWSQQAEELLGFAQAHVLGRSLYEQLCPAGGREPAREMVRETLEAGETDRSLLLARRDGEPVEVHVQALAVPHAPRAPQIVVVRVWDVDRARERRELLRTQERQLALLEAAENLGLGFVVTVEDATVGPRIVYANEPATELLGEELSALTGSSAFQHIAPEEHPRLQALRERVDQGGQEPRFVETTILRADGSTLPVEVGLGRCTYHGREATFAVFRDRSQGPSPREPLRLARQRLAQAEAVLQDAPAAAALADELAGELHEHLAYLYRVVKHVRSPRWTHPTLDDLEQAAEVLAAGAAEAFWRGRCLRRATHRAARHAEDSATVAPRTLRDVIDQAVDTLELQPSQEAAPVTVHVQAQLPPGLETRLGALAVEEALVCVLENAVAAAGPGGSVLVTAHRRDGAVEIRVVDDGPGMSERARAKACELFFTTRPGATGVGLTAARSILEPRGGHLEIASDQEGSTVVTLTLPVAETGAPGPTPAPGPDDQPDQPDG